MGTRSVRATELKADDVLALPFGKTATITEVKVGRDFVHLRLAGLPKTRVSVFSTQFVIDAATTEGEQQ